MFNERNMDMDINLNNFRTLANGTHNLGFVQLTRDANGQAGIDKANNFAHRTWKNVASEAASADNLVVRQKLVEAFEQAGACTGFIKDLRSQLGLDAGSTTAQVLTRRELKSIFDAYDDSVKTGARFESGFDALVEAKIPNEYLREEFAEQVRMLKSSYLDQIASAKTPEERQLVTAKFGTALADLNDTFTVADSVRNARDLADNLEHIEDLKHSKEKALEHLDVLKAFTDVAKLAEPEVNRQVANAKDQAQKLPHLSEKQRFYIEAALVGKVHRLHQKAYSTVREEMVEKRALDAKAAEWRIRAELEKIDDATMRTILWLGINCDGLSADKETLQALVASKLDEYLKNPQAVVAE